MYVACAQSFFIHIYNCRHCIAPGCQGYTTRWLYHLRRYCIMYTYICTLRARAGIEGFLTHVTWDVVQLQMINLLYFPMKMGVLWRNALIESRCPLYMFIPARNLTFTSCGITYWRYLLRYCTRVNSTPYTCTCVV